jgi:TonB family protein
VVAVTFRAQAQEPQPAPNSGAPQATAPAPGPKAETPSASATAPASPDSTHLEPIKIEKAAYPLEAREHEIQGQVWLKLTVSKTGDVENVEAISGDPILVQSAVAAAKKWKFKPFIKNGKPVKVSTKIPFDFAFGDQVKDTRSPDPPKSPAANEGEAPQRVHVAQGVSQGLLIHRVQPVYPGDARRNGIEGTVVLRALIGKDGRIQNLTPISGPKELIPAAVGAVQQWRYKPYRLNDEPVEVDTEVRVNFQLRPF